MGRPVVHFEIGCRDSAKTQVEIYCRGTRGHDRT
jgi:hypothetical protein